MLALHDTATGAVSELVPCDEGELSMYVCGPTVYGPPHVGHGRTSLVYDVLRRYLTACGVRVHHVSNVTDIDDKIIGRAEQEHRDRREIAEECEELWWSAMGRLGILPPDQKPHATDYVVEMVELIAGLVASGIAYQTSDGVYLAATEVPGYGLLAHQNLDSLRAGARVEVVEEKRSPVDFALWKLAKPGEPTWPSPFGEGRPGWHTECVVMSLALLGEGFDLHGGGLDLMFPHHENERAQAVASGHVFSRRWIHNGLVTVAGEKMSKSLGNFTTLDELLGHTDARAYRLLVLQSHYRSPLEVTAETLDAAAGALGRIDALARRFASVDPAPESESAGEARRRFEAAMDDDLDSPRAVAGLYEAMRHADALADRSEGAESAALARTVLELFAAVGVKATAGALDGTVEAQASDLVHRRDEARAARDFAAADALRTELEAAGYVVEDTPGGTRIYRRAG